MGSAGLDVVVVGGGPAGCAAAAAAQAAGMSVVLYSPGRPAWMRPVESLPPGGAALVQEIFGNEGFRAEDHLVTYANRSSWGSDDLESADFVFNPLGHGWQLNRAAFDKALLESVRALGVRIAEERVRSLPREAFVVDATGRSARIARALGIARHRADRLVAVFRPAAEVVDRATTVSAQENGWSYTAPGITAFLTDADLLPAVAGRTTDACTSWLEQVTGKGWAAAGDAAVAFDPLSSQGIVTALVMGREAGRLAAGLAEAREYADRYRWLLEEHLALRAAYYGLERRWPDAPFWGRRQRTMRATASGRSATKRDLRNASHGDRRPLPRRT